MVRTSTGTPKLVHSYHHHTVRTNVYILLNAYMVRARQTQTVVGQNE
jgi:hypothetical protein